MGSYAFSNNKSLEKINLLDGLDRLKKVLFQVIANYQLLNF
ncbi:MAG: hypothetical protein ACLUSV_02650 [Streptococcus sp.]